MHGARGRNYITEIELELRIKTDIFRNYLETFRNLHVLSCFLWQIFYHVWSKFIHLNRQQSYTMNDTTKPNKADRFFCELSPIKSIRSVANEVLYVYLQEIINNFKILTKKHEIVF